MDANPTSRPLLEQMTTTGRYDRNVRIGLLVVLMYGTSTLGQHLQVRGEVLDSKGAALGGATIRLLAEETRLTLRRYQANEYGRFEFGAVPAGRYMIAASAQGFREKLLPLGSVGTQLEVVRIRLDFIGCDAPGVNCDSFGNSPHSYSEPHPIRSKGYLHLRPSDVVDLDKGVLAQSTTAADIALEGRGDMGIYLTPLNTARIAETGAADSECGRGKYERHPVRIDGLGSGSDICVLTRTGVRSHLFITGEVVAASEDVRIYYVTRKR
jgi:hypothetical protein